jgi:hypothetical protein
MESFLVVRKGEPFGSDECLPLHRDGKIVIGRNWREHKPDVSFKSPYISRTHAIIEWKDGSFRLTDFSKHGTWINGKRIEKGKEYILKHMDEIAFAKREVVLIFYTDVEPGETLPYPDVHPDEEIIFDKETRRVFIGEEEYYLPQREAKLFELFYENKNKLVRIDEIMEHVWPQRLDSMEPVTEQEVRQLVYRLRKLLGRQGLKCIQTVRNEGYVFELP